MRRTAGDGRRVVRLEEEHLVPEPAGAGEDEVDGGRRPADRLEEGDVAPGQEVGGLEGVGHGEVRGNAHSRGRVVRGAMPGHGGLGLRDHQQERGLEELGDRATCCRVESPSPSGAIAARHWAAVTS